MGCGCHQRNIDYASNDDFLEKIRRVAKSMAVDDGAWYVVYKKDDGSFAYMLEKDFKKSDEFKDDAYVEYVSPVQ